MAGSGSSSHLPQLALPSQLKSPPPLFLSLSLSLSLSLPLSLSLHCCRVAMSSSLLPSTRLAAHETFQPAPGNSGYFVSNHGRVYNTARKRYITPTTIKIDGKNVALHRIVATLFVPNPQGLQIVARRDVDEKKATYNHHTNLVWMSRASVLSGLKASSTSSNADELPPEIQAAMAATTLGGGDGEEGDEEGQEEEDKPDEDVPPPAFTTAVLPTPAGDVTQVHTVEVSFKLLVSLQTGGGDPVIGVRVVNTESKRL